MSLEEISSHYAVDRIVQRITQGLAQIGKTPETITMDDLAPVDEFHIGGRQATIDFLDQLAFTGEDVVLDVGCGLGGPARFVATRYGSRVTGIDLTADYIAAGQTLCAWLGLSEQVTLQEESALSLPFDAGSFDGAYMIHVGMNIADKTALAAEVSRVLKPGARFGIYDVMRLGEGELLFPVPWAASAATSAVVTPDGYKQALQAAGFTILAERNRREFALEALARVRSQQSTAGGPPPLGLHLLLGEEMGVRFPNMFARIQDGTIAPVEIIAQKA